MASAKKIFVSYSHAQEEWVRGSLVAAYLASKLCRHEMERALAKDPDFQKGKVLPVVREKSSLPGQFKTKKQPIYVSLTNEGDAGQWHSLMRACSAGLGVSVADWISALDEICEFLGRNESLNLVVRGRHIKWRKLLDHIRACHFKDMGTVDLQSGSTASRAGLVSEILKAAGMTTTVPRQPGQDLIAFDQAFRKRSSKARVIITHFDVVVDRPYYDMNLFAAMRYVLTKSRKLVLLIQSRKSFAKILPRENPLSSISSLRTVELRAGT
jgi:hypothetical protein